MYYENINNTLIYNDTTYAVPILGQVATPRSFQLESILECPALDVRQLVRNKRRKEYDSHIT